MSDHYAFETIEWDDEEDPDGNLAHCLRHGVDEQVVAEVLRVDRSRSPHQGLKRPNSGLLARMNADRDCGPTSLTRAA